MSQAAIGWLWVVGQALLGVGFVLSGWELHAPIAVAVGVIIVVSGSVIGLLAMRTLGDALTPTPVPRDSATLRTNGIYAWVRHPIYTGLLTGMLGMLVAAGTGRGWIWWVVAIVFFSAKARWEDQLLRARYGTAWQHWAEHTGALLPRLTGRG